MEDWIYFIYLLWEGSNECTNSTFIRSFTTDICTVCRILNLHVITSLAFLLSQSQKVELSLHETGLYPHLGDSCNHQFENQSETLCANFKPFWSQFSPSKSFGYWWLGSEREKEFRAKNKRREPNKQSRALLPRRQCRQSWNRKKYRAGFYFKKKGCSCERCCNQKKWEKSEG